MAIHNIFFLNEMSTGSSTATIKLDPHNDCPLLRSSQVGCKVLRSELAHSERDEEMPVWADCWSKFPQAVSAVTRISGVQEREEKKGNTGCQQLQGR